MHILGHYEHKLKLNDATRTVIVIVIVNTTIYIRSNKLRLLVCCQLGRRGATARNIEVSVLIYGILCLPYRLGPIQVFGNSRHDTLFNRRAAIFLKSYWTQCD